VCLVTTRQKLDCLPVLRSVPPRLHHTPMALAPLIIRLGADASNDVRRRCARCTICGHKGATLKHPGWKNGGRVGAVPHRHDDTLTTRCDRAAHPSAGLVPKHPQATRKCFLIRAQSALAR